MLRFNHLTIIFLLSGFLEIAKAQIVDTRPQTEHLSFAERFSVKTNTVDWLLQNPNIGIEFDVRSENWNRWAAVINLKGHVNPSNTYTPGIVWNNSQVRLEARNYWRTRRLDGKYIMPHENWLGKLFSFRRMNPKHPLTVYYRGLYVGYDTFSFLLGNNKGVQGKAYSAGVTYGILRPMTVFRNGNSVDWEFGVSAGLSYTQYDKYKHDRENNCYPVTEKGLKGIFPALSDLHVGIVYRFGDYPMTKKYRFRYDVDMDYRNRMDSLMLARENRKAEQIRIDTLTRQAEDMFWEAYKKMTTDQRIDRYRQKAERTGQNADSLIAKKDAQYQKYAGRDIEEKSSARARKTERIKRKQQKKERVRTKILNALKAE